MINGHGDDLFRYTNIVANFSSNVYGGTDNTELIEHLTQVLPRSLGSYPEPEPYHLQDLLAKYHGVRPENIIVTNGATEAIYLIAHLFTGQPVRILEPTFSEYRSASTLFKSPIRDDAQIVWLCNPNNPTGQIQEELSEDKLLIVDRSYEYYARRALPHLDLNGKRIYIYSLTKRYKVPGLRIGYIITSENLAERIRQLRQPWSVNALAIEAGLWIVKNNFPETIDRAQLWRETDALKEELSQISGVEVAPTDTHFMLLRTPLLAHQLKESLALEYGLLVRDASNFVGLSPYHIRIATQKGADNKLLISALRDKLSAHKSMA